MANEKRLIDANSFSNGWMLAKFTEYNGRMRLIKTMQLQDVPTVDAVEVVHGHWINKTKTIKEISIYCFLCSACGHSFWNAGIDDFKYCPHCGARMDLQTVKRRTEDGK